MAKLTEAFKRLALILQEEATELSHEDIRSRLSSHLRDKFAGTGNYGYVTDIFGDDDSGDVVYSDSDGTHKAPYTMGTVDGKPTCDIDTDSAVDVYPRTVYDEQPEDEDHYSAMESALVDQKLYTALPLYERFISKGERDSADASDFAGKGKSYPILKPQDVMAAARSIGRAGSSNLGPSGLKARIIAIAKRKGWTKYLPKAWQDEKSSSSESHVSRGTPGRLELRESTDWRQDAAIHLLESAGSVRMKIKLIAPGAGASAFYPAEVLKRDGPNVFKDKTHIYINHATAAEEAARPAGDWHKLAGALDGNAYWDEAGKMGPGLYGNALFTSDYAPLVKEKAPFTGMSIRAEGVAEAGQKRNGLPVLKQLTSAESVDVVTRAGAGGMILSESARGPEGDEMTKEEIQALVEAGIRAHGNGQVAKLMERAQRGDATVIATRVLSTMALPEVSKQRVIEAVVSGTLPLTEAGEVDDAKLTPLVEAAAKKEGAYVAQLTGSGRVIGMGGAPAVAQLSEADQKLEEERIKANEADAENVFKRFGLNEAQAKAAAGKAA